MASKSSSSARASAVTPSRACTTTCWSSRSPLKRKRADLRVVFDQEDSHAARLAPQSIDRDGRFSSSLNEAGTTISGVGSLRRDELHARAAVRRVTPAPAGGSVSFVPAHRPIRPARSLRVIPESEAADPFGRPFPRAAPCNPVSRMRGGAMVCAWVTDVSRRSRGVPCSGEVGRSPQLALPPQLRLRPGAAPALPGVLRGHRGALLARRLLLRHAPGRAGAPRGLLALEGGWLHRPPARDGGSGDDGGPAPLLGPQAGEGAASRGAHRPLAGHPHLPGRGGPAPDHPPHRLQGGRARGPELLVDDRGGPLRGAGALPLPPHSPHPRGRRAEPPRAAARGRGPERPPAGGVRPEPVAPGASPGPGHAARRRGGSWWDSFSWPSTT